MGTTTRNTVVFDDKIFSIRDLRKWYLCAKKEWHGMDHVIEACHDGRWWGGLTSRNFPVRMARWHPYVRFRGTWSLFRESTGREYGHRWSPVAPWSRVADTNPSGGILCGIRDGTGRDGSSLTCSDPNHPVTPLPLLSFVRFGGCQPNPTRRFLPTRVHVCVSEKEVKDDDDDDDDINDIHTHTHTQEEIQ